MRIIGRNLENNRLILGELRNRIIGRFQSILCSGLPETRETGWVYFSFWNFFFSYKLGYLCARSRGYARANARSAFARINNTCATILLRGHALTILVLGGRALTILMH